MKMTTMFASKAARDLNRDPLPYTENAAPRYRHPADAVTRLPNGYLIAGCREGWPVYVSHAPRDEYAVTQTIEPNPYLLAFREYCSYDPESLWWAAGVWLNRLIEPDESYDAQHAIDLVDATLDDATRVAAKAHLIAVLNRLEGVHDARFAAA